MRGYKNLMQRGSVMKIERLTESSKSMILKPDDEQEAQILESLCLLIGNNDPRRIMFREIIVAQHGVSINALYEDKKEDEVNHG